MTVTPTPTSAYDRGKQALSGLNIDDQLGLLWAPFRGQEACHSSAI